MKSVEWHSYKYQVRRWLLKSVPWNTKRMIPILKHYGLVSESGNTIVFNGMRRTVDAVLIRKTYQSTYNVMNVIVTNLENDRRV